MDIQVYLKRMEAAVAKANNALASMTKENESLKSEIEQLKNELVLKNSQIEDLNLKNKRKSGASAFSKVNKIPRVFDNFQKLETISANDISDAVDDLFSNDDDIVNVSNLFSNDDETINDSILENSSAKNEIENNEVIDGFVDWQDDANIIDEIHGAQPLSSETIDVTKGTSVNAFGNILSSLTSKNIQVVADILIKEKYLSLVCKQILEYVCCVQDLYEYWNDKPSGTVQYRLPATVISKFDLVCDVLGSLVVRKHQQRGYLFVGKLLKLIVERVVASLRKFKLKKEDSSSALDLSNGVQSVLTLNKLPKSSTVFLYLYDVLSVTFVLYSTRKINFQSIAGRFFEKLAVEYGKTGNFAVPTSVCVTLLQWPVNLRDDLRWFVRSSGMESCGEMVVENEILIRQNFMKYFHGLCSHDTVGLELTSYENRSLSAVVKDCSDYLSGLFPNNVSLSSNKSIVDCINSFYDDLCTDMCLLDVFKCRRGDLIYNMAKNGFWESLLSLSLSKFWGNHLQGVEKLASALSHADLCDNNIVSLSMIFVDAFSEFKVWAGVVSSFENVELNVSDLTVWNCKEKMSKDLYIDWCSYITNMDNVNNAIALIFSFETLFAVEYSDLEEFIGPISGLQSWGWRTGESGNGETIEFTLQRRINVVKMQMKQVVESSKQNVRLPKAPIDLKAKLLLYFPFIATSSHFNDYINSSVEHALEQNLILQACVLWDECMNLIRSASSEDSNLREYLFEKENTIVDAELEQKYSVFKNLKYSCSLLLKLLTVACVECFVYTVCCSMESLASLLMTATLNELKTDISLSHGTKTIAVHDYCKLSIAVSQFLIRMPIPYGGNANSDLVYRVSKLVSLVNNYGSNFNAYANAKEVDVVNELNEESSLIASSWISVCQTRRTNGGVSKKRSRSNSLEKEKEKSPKMFALDKRYSARFMCYSVPHAITEWLERAYGRVPVFILNLPRRFDRWTRMLRQCETNQLLAIRVASLDALTMKNELPTGVVTTHWDSSLNSSFDSKCIVNTKTQMSVSERACGFGHAKIWRMIAGLHAHLFNYPVSFNLKSNALKDEALESNIVKLFKRSLLNDGWRVFSSERDVKHKSAGRNKKKNVVKISASESLNASNVFLKAVEVPHTSETGTVTDDIEDWYVIFEDDACFVRSQNNLVAVDMRTYITDAVSCLPNDWNICYLGYVLPEKAKSNVENFGMFLKLPYAWQLHAYVIRGSTAVSFLKSLPINMPVDNFLAAKMYSLDICGYGVKNSVIRQAEPVKREDRSRNVHKTSDINHSGSIL